MTSPGIRIPVAVLPATRIVVRNLMASPRVRSCPGHRRDPDRRRDALDRDLACLGGRGAGDRLEGVGGRDDLAALRERGNARGEVDADAAVVLSPSIRVGAVDADADGEGEAARPAVVR